ncbi:Coenzyme F420 hydrogenase/dehydrogenase, beta subunit C-terminal domain [Segatella copri]|uniref:Coenzyme F420 hydrogenase/dehydrogenase, beta subunit C-terminal domain n=2 Tax=Segatella copri TaxID=165179 RepID=UPI003F8C6062
MIRIDKHVDCCGCNACVQKCPKHCIKMVEDQEGFWYPVVDKNCCVNCGLCERVCPQKNITTNRNPLRTFALKHLDERVQLSSSSGGAFSVLAENIISEGGIVFGAVFDKNGAVIHDNVDNIKDLSKLRMSKYVQSKIGDSFKNVEFFLKEGKTVLFVGTPCQIHGLKLYLRKDYQNLLCVDFICHGVPSPKVWRQYLRETLSTGEKNSVSFFCSPRISKRNVLVKDIQFRNKSLGWKKFSFVLHYNLAEPTGDSEKNIVSSPLDTEHTVSETLYENPYLRGFIHDLYLRPSCYECRNKGFRSGSDITMGDFWGVEESYPELYDANGVSCLMVNTKHGLQFLSKFEKQLQEVDYLKVLEYNPSIEKPVKCPPFRRLFFRVLGKIPFRYIVLGGLIYNKIFRFLNVNK